jgi:hypothetical protein
MSSELFSNKPWNNRFFFGEGLLYSPHSSKLGDFTEGFSSPKIGDLIRFNFLVKDLELQT